MYSDIGQSRVRLELGSADLLVALQGDRTIVAETLRAAHRLLLDGRGDDRSAAIAAAATWLSDVTRNGPGPNPTFSLGQAQHHVSVLLNLVGRT